MLIFFKNSLLQIFVIIFSFKINQKSSFIVLLQFFALRKNLKNFAKNQIFSKNILFVFKYFLFFGANIGHEIIRTLAWTKIFYYFFITFDIGIIVYSAFIGAHIWRDIGFKTISIHFANMCAMPTSDKLVPNGREP